MLRQINDHLQFYNKRDGFCRPSFLQFFHQADVELHTLADTAEADALIVAVNGQ